MAAILELLKDLTAKSIVELIGSTLVKTSIGWFVSRLLNENFGDGSNSKDIIDRLDSIEQGLEKMKATLKEITLTVKWEHLNYRIFQAEVHICHKLQLLKSIISIENIEERNIEVKRLKKGILDTNNGVLSNLAVIHHALVGKTITNPQADGLLEMWSKTVYNTMIQNPMSAKTYQNLVMNFLHSYAFLQFVGITIFLGVSSSSNFCRDQLSLMTKNLECQIILLENTMPNSTKYLADPDVNNFFVLKPCSYYKVIYGPPVSFEGMAKRHELRLRIRSANNEDEEWIFEKSDTFDKDGSLLISENSKRIFDHYAGYIWLEENIPRCDALKIFADSFYVMPLHTSDSSMKVIICTSKKSSHRFLGYNPDMFINKKIEMRQNTKFTEFTMTHTKHPDY